MSGRLIAHQIHKEQHSRTARSQLRDALLPAENDIAELFRQQLRSAVTNRNPAAGRFTRPAGTTLPFEQCLTRYLQANSDQEFVKFTAETTQMLADRMQTEFLAVGGYVVYAEYEHADERVLLVAVLSTKAHPSFDPQLNLIAAETLDFDHLRYAGRIRLDALPENEDGVVHFVSRRAEEISDYFREFIGCEPVTDSATQGRQLFSSLRTFAESHALSTGDRQSMMQRTYSYAQECRRESRPMVMTALCNLLRPEDPTVVLRHFEQTVGLAGEFPVPPSAVMKQFKKFAFDQAGLKIEFDRNNWLDKVSTRQGSVIIRHAPPELIALIEEEKHVSP